VAWTGDGDLIYTQVGWRLRRLDRYGESQEIWPDQPPTRQAFFPVPVGDSDNILFTYCDDSCDNVREIWVLNHRSGDARPLIQEALRGWYLESGHIVYVRPDGAVLAVSFDAEALTVSPPEVPLMEGIRIDGIAFPDLTITSDGTALFAEGPTPGRSPIREAVWISRDGTVTSVDASWRFTTAWNIGLDLSPDGARLAIGLNTEDGDDVWIKAMDGGSESRLTDRPTAGSLPRWSADGDSVYYVSWREEDGTSDLWVQRADGAGEPELVLAGGRDIQDWDVTPGWDWVVARVGGVRSTYGGRDIIAYHLEGDTLQVPILVGDYDEHSPRLSPDGRWLAYTSQETGRREVYVRPFPDVESDKEQVSLRGGIDPLWAHSGRELFYQFSAWMMVATIDTTDGFRVLARDTLFRIPSGIVTGSWRTSYDVSPDDQRFVRIRNVPREEPAAEFQLILIENWFTEVKERVSQGGG
jgi:hypothetical protein